MSAGRRRVKLALGQDNPMCGLGPGRVMVTWALCEERRSTGPSQSSGIGAAVGALVSSPDGVWGRCCQVGCSLHFSRDGLLGTPVRSREKNEWSHCAGEERWRVGTGPEVERRRGGDKS